LEKKKRDPCEGVKKRIFHHREKEGKPRKVERRKKTLGGGEDRSRVGRGGIYLASGRWSKVERV